MLTQQFQTQFYLVHHHFELKPFLNDNSIVFYALLSFLYRNITFLKKKSHKKKGRKKEKERKGKERKFTKIYVNSKYSTVIKARY